VSVIIKNLTKRDGRQTVLNNISFEIGEGEIVGFLGPNGAGKTTTMRIITGVLTYDGSVKVCGKEVSLDPTQTNRLTGYLPEQNPLYGDMYIREYLLFVAETHCVKKDKKKLVENLVDKLGLRPEVHKKIRQLSKGYRQRVGLAQALINNPKVLVLDEPTTGLDPNQLEEVRSLIRELGKDRTVILSTHIMQEIKAICNRVIIINKGEIVADYKDISAISRIDESSFLFEVEFLQPVNAAELEAIPCMISASKKGNNLYTLLSSEDVRGSIFDFAINNNNKILSMKAVERSMEDVFRNLTKSQEKTEKNGTGI
jgi:ABC-2 type transport system ATP-binding protein